MNSSCLSKSGESLNSAKATPADTLTETRAATPLGAVS